MSRHVLSPDLFSDYYRKYYALAVQMVYKIDRDCRYAEDIVQEVFIKIWKHTETISAIDNFKSYLRLCVRNAYRNYKRDQQRSPWGALADFESVEYLVGNSSADERVRSETAIKVIDHAIAVLPEKRQRVFRMSRMDDLEHKEIARELGIHAITVAQYIGKSIDTLQDFKKELYSQCA